MDTTMESNSGAISTRVTVCLLIYCTAFMLSLWMSAHLEIPILLPTSAFLVLTVLSIVLYAIFRSCQRARITLDLSVSPRPRHPSSDSGYTSHYGATDTTDSQSLITNDDRFCQLCALRVQEEMLKVELIKLEMKANEAYLKHSTASQYICDHDTTQKNETRQWMFDGFRNASQIWYAADAERTKKKKELWGVQQKIKDLKYEMNEHFWDEV